MAVFFKITSPRVWARGDFSDQAARDVNMTVYADQEMTTVLDISSFTITLRIIRADFNGPLVYSTTQGLTGSSAGLLVWKPASGDTIRTSGFMKIRPRFESGTERFTAVGVNGSDEILIKPE